MFSESSFIKMDLNNLRSMSDIDRFFEHHEIPDGIWSKKWILQNIDHVLFWVLDCKSFLPICCVIRSEPTKIYWDETYGDQILAAEGYNPTIDVDSMTLDSVLEKVSQVGFAGLTQSERNFLTSQSKSI